MGIEGLYSFILLLVLVSMVTGIGVLLLDKLAATSSITATANTSVIAARDAVSGIATSWLSLIVTIAVLSLVLGLVIAGFSGYGRR